MPISYPLEMPVGEKGEVEFEWTPEAFVFVQPGEFTNISSVYAWPGTARRCAIKVGAMTEIHQAKAWEVFILKLNIRQGTFVIQDPIAQGIQGSITEAEASGVQVNGANQFGSDIVTSGWPAGETGLLLAGDFVEVGGRLRQVLENVNSDGGGAATIKIWPFAVGEIQDNEQIFVGQDAEGIFRIVDPPPFGWNAEKIREGFSFTAEEVVSTYNPES